MERDIEDLATEIRAVSESLFVLSREFESVDEAPGVGNETIHMMLFAVMKQLERIAEDLDKIGIERAKGETI